MILDLLNKKTSEKSDEIQKWLTQHSQKVLIPLYTSVDLRYSEHKICPVDTNVFPAGFNNLTEKFQGNTGKLFKEAITQKFPSSKKIMIVPELNTRNRYYWENIYVIKNVLEKAGFEVEAGIVDEEFERDEASFEAANGHTITAYKVFQKEDYTVYIENFTPDIILINNDFSEECPKSLRNIRQPVVPPIEIGWHTRRKDVHFYFYNKLAAEIAEILQIDPWHISIETKFEKGVDFDNPDDRERVSLDAAEMIENIKSSYLKRDIDYQPSIFVKSNSGTYGMAVISADDPEKIRNLNSKNRKKMRVSKGSMDVKDVVVQEGIPTSLKMNGGSSAEPVLYLVNGNVAGMFYRVNRGKDEISNLNSGGMEFVKYDHVNQNGIPGIFSVLSRVATVAAGYEIEKVIEEGGCG